MGSCKARKSKRKNKGCTGPIGTFMPPEHTLEAKLSLERARRHKIKEAKIKMLQERRNV